MTMGGLHDKISEEELQDLRSLITTVLGLPADYPEGEKFPTAAPVGKTWLDKEDLVECFVYFFDVAPGRGGRPDVKFYLPTRRYGPDDLTISQRMVEWMKARGRGDYGDAYLRMMEAVAEHRGLENGKGLHSYISYQFGKGGGVPDIKSYLTPETYHPARFPESGQTRE
jgi:DMATS type aromatic prenyltransferase